MNIVYTSSDLYAQHAGVSIFSLFENNKEAEEIIVYLVAHDISEKNLNKLYSVANKYKRKLIIIPASDIEKMFGFELITGHYTVTNALRLLIGRILPYEVDKVIYLDSDTVIDGSLMELWNSPFENNIMMACLEPSIDKKFNKSIGLALTDHYFNSGLLYIDLNRWRNDNIESELLEFYKKHDGNLKAMDQDVLNGTLKGRIKIISPKFNFSQSYYYYPYWAMKKFQSPAKFIDKSVYEDAQKNPIVIHYIQEERPWREGCLYPLGKKYDYYLSLSPWKGAPKEKGWRLYFICFTIFNTITNLYPPFRRFVINTLGPAIIKTVTGMRKKYE